MRILLFLLVIATAMIVQPHSVFAQTQLPPGFIEEAIVAGLDTPTGFALSPDGRIFFTEKTGRVRVVQNGVLQYAPFIDLRSEVNTYRDRGMLGIAVHPQFPAYPYIYVAYVYNPPQAAAYNWTGARVSRLVRLEANPSNPNVAMPERTTVLLGTNSTFAHIGNPSQPNTAPYACRAANGGYVRDCLPSDGTTHTMGTVLFGADGALYVGNGDGVDYGIENMRAQDIDSLAGKILRIDPLTGNGYPNNPYYDGDPTSNRSKVFALGMRNPFRFTLHPYTRALWIGDVGNSNWEEISSGYAGANFGWPCYEGFARAATYQSCQARFSGQIPVNAPVHAYPHNGRESAIIGGDIYAGTTFPSQYHNAYFFGDFNAKSIRYLPSGASQASTFATNALGMVQMKYDPSSGGFYALYLLTGSLVRIRYGAAGSAPIVSAPVASTPVASAPVASAPVASAPVASAPVASAPVASAPVASAPVASAPVASNSPPTAQILSPTSSTRYGIGDLVHFSGRGVDREDGDLASSKMQWDAVIHHNQHVHYDAFRQVGASGSFPYQDHEDNSYLELCLTVTDSSNASAKECVDVRAKEIIYYFNTEPSGLTLMYAGSRYKTPFIVKTYQQAQRFIGAPPNPTSGLFFDRWSDAGPPSHMITTGHENTSMIAHYRQEQQTTAVTGNAIDTASAQPASQTESARSIQAQTVPAYTATPTPTFAPTSTPTFVPTSTATSTPTYTPPHTPTHTPTTYSPPVATATISSYAQPLVAPTYTPTTYSPPAATATTSALPSTVAAPAVVAPTVVATTVAAQPVQQQSSQPRGTILYERWDNIGGDYSINSLLAVPSYPLSPSHQALWPRLEAPSNLGDGYGSRMRGYLYPPVTGDYLFSIAGDDAAQLWLSTNNQPANKQLIAYTEQWTDAREWDRYAEQSSRSIRLEAGKRYYIEALHKEVGAKDNLAVAWTIPNSSRVVIGGYYLSPVDPTE